MERLDQVRDVIWKKHCSIMIEDACFEWIRRYIPYYEKGRLKDMGEVEFSQYLSDLAPRCMVAAGTQQRALCVLVLGKVKGG